MRLLLTGGSGFIGTRLATELVEAGHEVILYDLARSDTHPQHCVQGDIRDLATLSAAATGTDAIIHLAAEHRDDALSTALCEDVNVGGAQNVVHAARQAGCRRIIFTSSVAVYPLDAPLATEDFPPKPHNRYGASKLAAEQLFIRWARDVADATLTIVRPCVVFGEGNRGNVYNLIRQIRRRRFVMVGNGRNRKSMAYVGNLTRFLAKCLEFPPGIHLYNYADKPDLSVSALVALARCALNALPSNFGLATSNSQAAPSLQLSALDHPLPSVPISDFGFRISSFDTIRLPFWLGLSAGLCLDSVAKVTGRQFSISASRIRKFCAETTVSVERLEKTGFVRPYQLEAALRRTIAHDFFTR